jgi:hypothetical protein
MYYWSERKEVIAVFLLPVFLLIPGCGLLCGNGVCNSIPFIHETFFNCPEDCSFCDDLNRCTYTFFNYSTQECDYYNISDCCGNGVCEPGESCPVDCTDCDDNDVCTLDYYNIFIDECSHETVYGCCGNQLCEINENCEICPEDCGACFGLNELIPLLNSGLKRIYDYELQRISITYEKEYIAKDSNIVIYEFEPKRFVSKQQMVEFMMANQHNYFNDHRQLLEFKDYYSIEDQISIGNQDVVIRTTIHTNASGDSRKSSVITYIGYPCRNSLLLEIYSQNKVNTYYYGSDYDDDIIEIEKNKILDEQDKTLKTIHNICTV